MSGKTDEMQMPPVKFHRLQNNCYGCPGGLHLTKTLCFMNFNLSICTFGCTTVCNKTCILFAVVITVNLASKNN